MHQRSRRGAEGGPASPRTVAYVHAVLRKAFGDAVLVDQAARPTRSNVRSGLGCVPPNPARSGRPRCSGFLRGAETHRLFAFFHLAAYTGARRGELLNLRWRDVDLDGASAHIRGSAAFIAGERIEGTTKSGRSRTVSIDPGTVDVLKAHRKRQLADKLRGGQSWKCAGKDAEGFVVATGWGEPIHPDTASSLATALIKLPNAPKDGAPPAEPLPHKRLHDLRHIHATILLLAGVPVHVVAARLGHADPSITLRVYAHVVNQQLVEAAEIFARRVEDVA